MQLLRTNCIGRNKKVGDCQSFVHSSPDRIRMQWVSGLTPVAPGNRRMAVRCDARQKRITYGLRLSILSRDQKPG